MAKNRLSDNVVPVKHFLSALTRALRRAFGHRSRLSLSVSPPFGSECLTSFADGGPTMPYADFCPAIGPALRPASVADATQDRSPEVSSAAFRAQSPNLRFACLMDMDFAVSGLLVPCSRLISGFCPSTRAFAPRFLWTPPRSDSPCASLILHLHQVG